MPPLSIRTSRAVCALAGVLCSVSCGPEPTVLKLQGEVAALTRENKELRAGQDRIEADIRRIWGKVNCSNERVRDFIRRCAGSSSPGCSDDTLASALSFMNSQPYVTMYLSPDSGIVSLLPIRRGQLLELADSHLLFPTTRFLILVQPAGETPKQLEDASWVGNQVLQHLRVDLGVGRAVPIHGPHLLPCKGMTSMVNLYSGRLDNLQPGEPRNPKSRVRAWVFRTDCGD